MFRLIKYFYISIFVFLYLIFYNSTGFSQEELVSMSFKDTNIDTVLEFFGEISGTVIINDPNLKDKINIVAPKQCTVTEAMEILNDTLMAKGFTLVKTGKIIRIVSLEYAKQNNLTLFLSIDAKKLQTNSDIVTQMISLKYAKAKEIARIIKSLVNKYGEVIVYDKTNTILITDLQSNVKRLVEIINQLDVDLHDGSKIKVYRIKYGNVCEIAKIIEGLGDKKNDGEIKVLFYKKTNTLIIKTNEKNFMSVEKLISELDNTLPQILIETIIIEANKDRLGQTSIDFLSQYESPDKKIKEFNSKKLKESFNWKDTLNPSEGTGFSWLNCSGFVDSNEYSRFMKELVSNESVKVVSAPNILTANNKEATIITMGEQIPYIKGKTLSSESTDKKARYDYVYDYKNVGVKLTVIPQINENDFVQLKLHQEVKNKTGESMFKVPTIQTREADTTVFIKNGQTVVVGGLVKGDMKRVVNKIPVLGDIPLLGFLFRGERNIANKTELIVFITPRIILNNRDISSISKKEEKVEEKIHEKVKEEEVKEEKKEEIKKVEEKVEEKKEELKVLFADGFEEGVKDIKNDEARLEGIRQEVKENLKKEEKNKKKNKLKKTKLKIKNVDDSSDKDKKTNRKKSIFEKFFSFGSKKDENKKEENKQDKEKKENKSVEYKENMEVNYFVDKEIKPKTKEDVQTIEVEKMIEAEPEIIATKKNDVGMTKDGYILKETFYRRGIEFYKKGQYKGAIREFAPIMSIDPNYKNIAKYMYLCEKKFEETIDKELNISDYDKQKKQEIVENFSTVSMSMDAKKNEVAEDSNLMHEVKDNTLFENKGDAINVPEDRIDSAKTKKLVGKIIEISKAHDFVIINLGEFDKVNQGMVFKIYRENELIGKISASEIEHHVSGASIISKKYPEFNFIIGDTVVLSE